jgi:hypothetical protein
MTSRLEPKISNFTYSRESEEESIIINIKIVDDITPWMAPERMREKTRRYDFKCEIFRYVFFFFFLKLYS